VVRCVEHCERVTSGPGPLACKEWHCLCVIALDLGRHGSPTLSSGHFPSLPLSGRRVTGNQWQSVHMTLTTQRTMQIAITTHDRVHNQNTLHAGWRGHQWNTPTGHSRLLPLCWSLGTGHWELWCNTAPFTASTLQSMLPALSLRKQFRQFSVASDNCRRVIAIPILVGAALESRRTVFYGDITQSWDAVETRPPTNKSTLFFLPVPINSGCHMTSCDSAAAIWTRSHLHNGDLRTHSPETRRPPWGTTCFGCCTGARAQDVCHWHHSAWSCGVLTGESDNGSETGRHTLHCVVWRDVWEKSGV